MSSCFQLNSAHTLDASERNVSHSHSHSHMSWIPAPAVPQFDRNVVHQIAPNTQSAQLTHCTWPRAPTHSLHMAPCPTTRHRNIWDCNVKLGCPRQELTVFRVMARSSTFRGDPLLPTSRCVRNVGKETPLQGGVGGGALSRKGVRHSQQWHTQTPNFDRATLQMFVTTKQKQCAT